MNVHVTSLFTNDPFEKSLGIIQKSLWSNYPLETRTNLSTSAIKDLLELFLEFRYRNLSN